MTKEITNWVRNFFYVKLINNGSDQTRKSCFIKFTTIASCLFLVLVALSPNLAWLIVAAVDSRPLIEGLLPAILGLSLLVFASPWIWHATLILALLALPALAETWYVISFGKPTDSSLFGVLSESNSAELFGFVSGLWGYFLVAIFLIIIIAAPVTRLLHRVHARWPTRSRWLIVSGSLIGLFLVNSILWLPDPSQAQISGIEDVSSDKNFLQFSLQEHLSAYSSSWPTGLPVRVLSFLKDRNRLSQARSEIDGFRFDAEIRPNHANDSKKIILLVIGESSRPDRWQLFGYNRETTPQLSMTKNIIIFPDAISPWAWTRMSVPLIITRKPATDKSTFFPEKSFISAFNEAGFETDWFSNHNFLGMHESPTSVYAQDADSVTFLNPASYKDSGSYDDVLIPELARVIQAGKTRKLIVLHMLGSHFNYAHRYPENFNRFTPSHPETGELSLHDKLQVEMLSNAYDNSILFTDYVLSEIIRLLAHTDQPSALIYVADHGENLFSDQCDLSGHGLETAFDFRVPMFFWWSESFGMQHPEVISQARINSQKPVSTEAIFHSIIDLAGISFTDEDLSRSVFSEHYFSRPRWVYASGGINFETAAVNQACKLIPGSIN